MSWRTVVDDGKMPTRTSYRMHSFWLHQTIFTKLWQIYTVNRDDWLCTCILAFSMFCPSAAVAFNRSRSILSPWETCLPRLSMTMVGRFSTGSSLAADKNRQTKRVAFHERNRNIYEYGVEASMSVCGTFIMVGPLPCSRYGDCLVIAFVTCWRRYLGLNWLCYGHSAICAPCAKRIGGLSENWIYVEHTWRQANATLIALSKYRRTGWMLGPDNVIYIRSVASERTTSSNENEYANRWLWP